MKTSIRAIAFFILTITGSQAQADGPTVGASQSTAAAAKMPADTAYQVVESGAHHNVWQRETYEAGPNGLVVTNVHQYTELATGLNHLLNGQWVASMEEIVILPNGTAAATNGQHQAYFPGNIYSGVIRMVTPDGQVLQSRPVGMSYDDGSNMVMIAELTNSIGYVVGANQVIYPNAFTGFKADLRYTYTKAGFEQDVILRQQPHTPESLGLNADTARLQVLTEFFSPPPPAIQSSALPEQAGLALSDQSLGFGMIQMAQGRAFLLGQNGTDAGALVAKQWVELDGRRFLVEEVPVDAIEEGLAALPLTAMNSGSGKAAHLASRHLALPPQRLVQKNAPKTMLLAKAELPAQGLVMDYVAINTSMTNYTFQGDNTYYISGPINLSGTNTFEGGAVIKYATNGLIAIEGNVPGTSVQTMTSAYSPAIFTSANDNSVGNSISGSTGNPTNGSYVVALRIMAGGVGSPGVLSNLRIAYGQSGITIPPFLTAKLFNVQVMNCGTGCNANGTVTFENALFGNDQIDVQAGYYGQAYANNVTFSGSSKLGMGINGELSLSNCILANVTNTGNLYIASADYNGFYNTAEFGANAITNNFNPFQTIGAGSYYLTNGCAFTNAGDVDIDPALLASLQQKTTRPPILYSNTTISTATTFSPQAQRDNVGDPDLGYHYDPIDYELTECSVTNTTLTLTNGATVAVFGTNCLQMLNGSQIVSVGTPVAPNWIVPSSAVQEQQQSSSANLILADTSATVSGLFDFTKFSVLAAGGYQLCDNASSTFGNLSVQNCEFWGGINDLSGATNTTTVTLMNNLFCRSSLFASNNAVQASLFLTNNTVWGTTVTLDQPSGGLWSAFNNDFDTCTVGGTLTNGFNGYLNDTGRLLPTNSFDVVSVPGLAYQSSFLGAFYQPTNSPLIEMGSTTADQVGLYHFTTQTNQVPETNSMVDIGYHYVATDMNGNPLETLWFGIPDYLADTNGELAAWEMEYFGHLGLDPNSDPDGDGNTLLYDYLNGVWPDTIGLLSINAANNYWNTSSVPAQLDVSGAPYYIAVSVDDTNYIADAVWNTYSSSNITVNPGTIEGWHDVWIGLRGHADATNAAVWGWKRLKVDFTPPQLTLTSPTSGTVNVPLIQLQGFSPEALGSISYDLTNATGLVTNQPVLVLNQYYDTNTWEFTTNNFQAFDVPLTNGVNTITLHATDLAGNVTTLMTNFTLDYSGATNPVVQLTWPTNGMTICQGCFTLRGTVDDPTAIVSACITDTNGNTNVISGEVERTGILWAENLPLAEGTNWVTLSVTNAPGLSSVTNIYVVKSDMTLALTSIDGDLWQPTVNVGGTVSDSTAAIYVNGVPGTNNGDGTWSAASVPVSAGGVASFDLKAIPAGGGDPDGNTNVDKPWELYRLLNQQNMQDDADEHLYDYGSEFQWTSHWDDEWLSGFGGAGSSSESEHDVWDGGIMFYGYENVLTFAIDGRGYAWGDWVYYDYAGTPEETNAEDFDMAEVMADEHCNVTDGWPPPASWSGGDGVETYTRTAQMVWHLQTGGKALPQRQSLWQLSGGATQIRNKRAVPPEYLDANGVGIPPQNIQITGKALGSDGNLWVVLPDAQDIDVTPYVAGVDYYTFSVGAQKYHCYIGLTTSTTNANLETDTPEVCVGQTVNMNAYWLGGSSPPSTSADIRWHLPDKYVNEQYQYSSTCTSYRQNADALTQSGIQCWYVNLPGGACSVHEILTFANGQSATVAAAGSFTVFRPTAQTTFVFSPFYFTLSDITSVKSKLQLGDSGGMGSMAYWVNVYSKYSGVANITQLITASYSNPFYNFSDERCDGTPPYNETPATVYNNGTSEPIYFQDGPEETWEDPNTVSIAARDFVQFSPGGAGDIYVTLGVVHWNASATAKQYSFYGDWFIQNPTVTGPDDPDDSDAFPVWTRIKNAH